MDFASWALRSVVTLIIGGVGLIIILRLWKQIQQDQLIPTLKAEHTNKLNIKSKTKYLEDKQDEDIIDMPKL